MFSEKPWNKEFRRLINDINNRWGCTYTDPHKPSQRINFDDKDFARIDDKFFYRIFSFKINEHEFFVTISEFALPGYDLIDSADNSEYLSLTLGAHCGLRMALRHEHFMDRFKKKIGLENEIQVGDPGFDREYFIISRPNIDAAPIRTGAFRTAIRAFEPFSGIFISPGSVTVAQALGDENTLCLKHIEEVTAKLVTLAKLVPPKKPL